MKTEFTEVSDTRRHLTFEVPPDVVDAEIDRVARTYSRSARVPGFRQGKVPTSVVRQRYRDQILHEVAHELIPRVVGSELKERGLQPVGAPDIRDVVLEEGKPLTFLADFETMPSIDLGEYTGLSLRKPPAVLEVGAVDTALEQLRQRAARWKPIEDRSTETGDTILVDLTRTRRGRLIQLSDDVAPPSDMEGKPEKLQNVSIEIGNEGNPPEFNTELVDAPIGATRSFPVNYPSDYEVQELAGATIDYEINIKAIRRKEVLPLDDAFAKEVSELETLDALRERVQADLQQAAEQDSEHKIRHDLLTELGNRVKSVPDVLVEQEIDRRLEEFVHRLADQGIDPMKAEIDWAEFRERQRQSSVETVKSTMAIDEVARREDITASDDDVSNEIAKFAGRAGRTPAAAGTSNASRPRGRSRARCRPGPRGP